jgi:transcriptional regulator with XRE-family HTH domain
VIDATGFRPLRQAAGITLAQAAADLGRSAASYLSGIERGRSTHRELLTTYRDYLTTRQHTG